jgi:3-isopropylmalate/(R)-2-methylmalate dehydratase large subunit
VHVINREFGETDLLLQGCVEFAGPGLSTLSMDARQGLLSGMYHCGADTAVMPVDELARAYVESRAEGRPWEAFESDPDATFALERSYDLSAIEPVVTVPPEQHTVVPARELKGTRVDHATIGTCANNRLEDLRAAAEVLRGRRIAPHVALYVSPGSPEIFAAAAADGTLSVLSDAGAMILGPGCNTCFGYVGALSAGQTAISTQQQNYHGRSGSPDARIFLGSPYVVAASAVAGEILDPREMLEGA